MAAVIDQVCGMLESDADAKRVAAAIVLAELGRKDAKVVRGLGGMLEEESNELRLHALEAVATLGIGGKLLDVVLDLLGARDDAVRDAAVRAAVTAGPKATKAVEALLEEAKGVRKRALETVLSRLGGKAALGALLAALVDDPSNASAVASELRKQLAGADARTRKSVRAQIEAFLKEHAKNDAADVARGVALQVVGYLEDASTLPLLLKYAKNTKEPAVVRERALIALRFAIDPKKPDAKIVAALLDAAEAEDKQLGQSAMLSLVQLPVTKKVAEVLLRLANHPDINRALLAIRRLATEPLPAAADALAELVAGKNAQRAELASDAIRERRDAGLDDGTATLIGLLGKGTDGKAADQIRRLLEPVAPHFDGKLRKKLLSAAGKAFDGKKPGWKEAYRLAARSDAGATAKAIRTKIAAARKARKKTEERALLELLLLIGAEAEDRYRLASLALAESKLDTRKAYRKHDAALAALAELSRDGFDVVAAMRKDRSVSVEQLFYVGFHFIEEDAGPGEDLLADVVKKAGRKKIGKAAKNKLALEGF